MKCTNCGYDNNENARFCQICGSALNFNQNPLSKLMFNLLNDNIFMILCILFSVSTGFSVISGHIPILMVIMTIFLWLVFAQNKSGNIAPNYLRYISGTIFASYVIRWVFCCIMALCGLLLAVLPFIIDTTKFRNMLYYGIESYINNYLKGFSLVANFYLLFFTIVFLAIAIVYACLNIFGIRKIHRFAQSIYKSLEHGQTNITKRSAAQTWMMIFGILEAILATLSLTGGNIFSFFEKGCLSAVYILGYVLVNKYFGKLK